MMICWHALGDGAGNRYVPIPVGPLEFCTVVLRCLTRASLSWFPFVEDKPAAVK